MESREKIYKAFYEVKNKWLYFSELKQKTKLSNSSLQNVLKKMKESEEIIEDKKTSNIFFRLNPSKLDVIFKRVNQEKFQELNMGVRIPLKNWLKQIPRQIESVVLFGSASRKQEKEGSDIDLLVVLYSFLDKKLQILYEKEIKQKINKITKNINSESNFPLKVIFTNTEILRTSKDYLIMQAKETGFPIYGDLKYEEN